MSKRLSSQIHHLQSGWRAYLVLFVILALTYVALAMRGFHLGFYGDVVAYQWHYTFDGLFGGMNWLITDHWKRHLLGAFTSAPLHMLFPTRYDLWYALALGLHVTLGGVIFLLVDTLQAGKRRWLALAVALFFVFDTFQTPSNIEFATGSHRKASLILAVLSLWSYVLFVRSKRQHLSWYIINLTTFIFAVMIYEQSFFFFALHPLIGLIEDRRTGEFSISLRYVWITFRDSFLHGVFVLIYVYLLLSLFVGGNSNLELSPAYIIGQIVDGLSFQLNPILIINRLSDAIAISQLWVIGLLGGVIFLFFGGWIWLTDDENESVAWSPLWIIVFGLLLMLLNISNAAPTVWRFDTHSRLIYASSIGTGMILAGGLSWLIGFNRRIGGFCFALVMAIFLSSGISYLYAYQTSFRTEDEVSSAVYNAIFEAIPEFADDAQPYLLLITDVDADDDLALHPQDFNFPRVFALHYGIKEFRADAVLYDIDDSLTSQQIQLTDDGIISPLRADEVIAYDRVVIVEYDSQSQTATLIDTLSDEMIDRGNFIITAESALTTNFSLLATLPD